VERQMKRRETERERYRNKKKIQKREVIYVEGRVMN
jgi:hypothetical protein